jgi:hypothetical protein
MAPARHAGKIALRGNQNKWRSQMNGFFVVHPLMVLANIALAIFGLHVFGYALGVLKMVVKGKFA